MAAKRLDSGANTGSILARPFTCCVTLGKFLNLHVPLFLYLSDGRMTVLHEVLVRLMCITHSDRCLLEQMWYECWLLVTEQVM